MILVGAYVCVCVVYVVDVLVREGRRREEGREGRRVCEQLFSVTKPGVGARLRRLGKEMSRKEEMVYEECGGVLALLFLSNFLL